jgi:hypothetical protein
MMPVLGSRARARQRANYVRIVIISLVIIAAIGAMVYSKISQVAANDLHTLCPAGGPLGHTVLLVDKSDPLTFTQSKEFNVLYQEIVTKRVPKGHLLSVYALGDDFQKTAEPIIELCNPGDGSGLSTITSNPSRVLSEFQTKYVAPMLAKASELVTSRPSRTSPIMEMIQLVGITGFRKKDVKGPRQLIIVSDLLQNTAEFSMYRGIPTFAAFLSTPYAAKAIADLPGVQVELQVFMHSPQIQKPELLTFWEEYIFKAKGKLTLFNPIKG